MTTKPIDLAKLDEDLRHARNALLRQGLTHTAGDVECARDVIRGQAARIAELEARDAEFVRLPVGEAAR